MIPEEQLTALVAKAEKATRSPWTVLVSEQDDRFAALVGSPSVEHVAELVHHNNAEFMAAASPDLVLALVAAVRQARTDADQARAENKRLRDAHDSMRDFADGLTKRGNAALAGRDAARAEVEQLAVLLAEREDVCTRRGAELADARARVAELEAVRDGEVMVEGSWFKRADLSTALADARRALGDLAAVARNETRAMDLWWRTSGDDWAVPNDLPGRFLAAALAASRSSSPVTEAVTEPETMPWWRANPPVVGRTAVDVIAWITKAGGEARYEPEWRGWLTHGPRIVITGPDGDVVMAPGDEAVKGNWFVTDGPIGSRQRRDLREFTVVRRPTPEETT